MGKKTHWRLRGRGKNRLGGGGSWSSAIRVPLVIKCKCLDYMNEGQT